MSILADDLYNGLLDIPLLDIHTHLDASHLGARGLHDILLYHMVISDLYSAGCPDGSRLPEEPSEDEVESRIERALPYIRYIQNTSCFWGVKTILKDLYGWEQPINKENWQQIHDIIKNKSKNVLWSREILKKAGIAKACTELWRGHSGKEDDILQYSLEWAFFARCQWGQYDTALLELENAWNQEEPGAPLPVNMGENKLEFERNIENLQDVKDAIGHYCDKIPYDRIVSTAQHLSTDIQYRIVSDGEMEDALSKRSSAGEMERDIYANYILECFLSELEKRNRNIVFHFSFGAEPLPFETGSKLKPETIFQLAGILKQHPTLKFQAFLSSEHQNQAMCTLSRELPNLSLAGYWWHNFFPGTIRKVMNERLDMLAANKQVGFFSDAYCVDWAYAKAFIVRKQLAEVLAGKIEQGQYTKTEALTIANQVLLETPKFFMK